MLRIVHRLPCCRKINGFKLCAKESTWNWVPPKASAERDDDEIIPVVPGQLLTTDEICNALKAQGAEDVLTIALDRKMDTISHFVIASGRSSRHLQKLSSSIVRALKSRNLTQAAGYTGAEGEKNDDWLLVDCHTIAVHMMLPATRKSLDLENHWKPGQTQPCVEFSADENIYEDRFAKLLEAHPCPESYNVTDNDVVKQLSKHIPKL